ncbi:phage shock protein PspA [Aestuariibacter sp. AA17]|uniref:Phage shock protein PspA n=1 Tax=Fluctibacter corallii TaxID=2984329 RepID=A0ABT3AD89_9ALTE|nr:phage shock protein PspA [Aestuariibacter sp. AA17]MCV2886643.1 phage shock protein PspA [Aestuariibacter sp. AA17]
MGMFSRISDIVQANINAILDKAEDPQKVIRLIIQEMEETMVEVRSVAARHLAEKKSVERSLDKTSRQMQEWNDKAQLAVEKGREDLAKAALQQKHVIADKHEALTKEAEALEVSIAKLQEDTAQLAEKLTEARNRQKSLQIRHTSATTRLKVKTTEHMHKIDDAIARFDMYERKIDDLEAQVESYDFVKEGTSLDAEFKALASDDKIEAELEALRKKVA